MFDIGREPRRAAALALVLVLLTMLVAGLFMVAPAPAVRAATLSVGDTVVVNTDVLNLRSGANLSASVLRVLPAGTSLTVTTSSKTADSYTWYGVTMADGTNGWVAGEYLAAPADSTWNGGFTVGDTAVVDTARLNCRSGPGLSYGVLYVLSGDETVEVQDGPQTADGYHWFKITTEDGDTGWVIGEGLAPTSDNGGTSGGFQFNEVVTVAEGPLNVHNAAGLDATITGQLSEDAPACILNGPVSKDGYIWYLVFYGENSKGWVAGEFLAPETGGATAASVA